MLALLESLESHLLSACVTPDQPDNSCFAALRAHFAAGGARVRARICLEAGDRVGLAASDTLHLAAGCELLHNASLVQDDLLDRTQIRRGRTSIWLEFGETIAICVSDLMLSGAYASVARLTRSTALPAILSLLHERTRDVILGQAMENDKDESFASALSFYEARARGKSASLLSLPLELPLLVSGHQDAMQDARRAADCFAVAYQMFDDLEDVEQDEVPGSLNVVLLLEQRLGLPRSEARSIVVTRALQLLRSADDLSAKLPCKCATVMTALGHELAGKLAARRQFPFALAGV
jgi:geranylgeranyl diphosphate synthase type II